MMDTFEHKRLVYKVHTAAERTLPHGSYTLVNSDLPAPVDRIWVHLGLNLNLSFLAGTSDDEIAATFERVRTALDWAFTNDR